MDIKGIFDRVTKECEERAQRLAKAGRANRLRCVDGLTREEEFEEVVKWVFWKMANQSDCEKSSSGEANMVSIIHTVANRVRADERRRIAGSIGRALAQMLGDEASLISDVNDAMGFRDE